LEIPYDDRWYANIFKRHSRRQYTSTMPAADLLQIIRSSCREFRPFPGARVELATESPDSIFRGALGSYGKVKDAPAYLVMVGNTHEAQHQAHCGFTGEGIILEATALGLSTCWVGGFFNPAAAAKQVHINPGEQILAVSPLGYSRENKTFEEKILSGFARSYKRSPVSSLVDGLDQSVWPGWLSMSLEAARLAPSAMNRQPWRFTVEKNSITLSTAPGLSEFGVSKRLDCGIAMLHFELAALKQGIHGRWEWREEPQVASFKF
jgi:hypothetical protein